MSAKPALPLLYLLHLDGLRAVALLGVLLFHFSVAPFDTGFLGVDVFLVLSGFLISRNLVHTLRSSTFSLHRFYIRRFWRLYPSSATTVGGVVAFSFLLFPADLAASTARSALASLGLAANVYFWNSADYFDDDPIHKPLLHVWSLALEEQFYCFWPIVLAFAYRRNALPVVVFVVGVASFALSTYLYADHPSFVFYMLPCRVYEFAAGALVALLEPRWAEAMSTRRLSRVARPAQEALSAASLVTVLASFALGSPRASPLQVLLVVLSTCIVIVTPTTFSGRVILSNWLSRSAGRLSYAAYLVHWPVVVFVRYLCAGLHLHIPSPALLGVLTFVSAAALRAAVEEPLRQKGCKHLATLVAAVALIVAFCVVGVCTGGWAFRLEGRSVPGGGSIVARNYRHLCKDPENVPRKAWLENYSDGCLVGNLDAKDSKIVVIGDSFARHLIPAFDRLGKRRGLRFTFNFLTNCSTMAIKDEFRFQKSSQCRSFHEKRWKLISGAPVKNVAPLPRNATFVVAGFGEYGSLENRRRRLVMLDNDFRAAGHRILVAGEPPGVARSEKWRFACLDIQRSPLLQILKLVTGKKSSCVSSRIAPKWDTKQHAKDYKAVFGNDLHEQQYINLYDSLCKEDKLGVPACRTLSESSPDGNHTADLGYARDGRHVTVAGSEFLSTLFEQQLAL